MSPLLANIAVSALDDEFVRRWEDEMAAKRQRAKRQQQGLPNYRLVRYADLSRDLDKSAYAEDRIMPRVCWAVCI